MADKKYNCPYCDKRMTRKDLITHIDFKHHEMIPEGFTATRVVYNHVNKVQHGTCRVCKKETPWNESAGRYDVLCGDPKCKEYMREQYKKNMLRVKGTYNILNDPEQQKKMLAGRKISGTYKFSDGGVVSYTGSYEKKCLEFMDIVMCIPSKDIMSPGPTLEYEYNGEKHFYITDFYYIPYNLIIEVKDGGDNINKKESPSMKASREKTIEKEHLVTSQGEYNYIRLTNNNFQQLLEIFMDIKFKLIHGDTSKTYKINEQAITEAFLDESKVINSKDIYYNKEAFDNGGINLCFITGYSGSGKSTMAHGMKAEVTELDDVVTNWNFSDSNLKAYGDLIYSFFMGPGKKYRVTKEYLYQKQIPDTEYEVPLVNDFIKYAKSYAKSHKNKKFVIEGIWLLTYNINPAELKDCAVYIKGTSKTVSTLRARIRDSADASNPFERTVAIIKGLKNHPNTFSVNDRSMKAYVKYFG